MITNASITGSQDGCCTLLFVSDLLEFLRPAAVPGETVPFPEDFG